MKSVPLYDWYYGIMLYLIIGKAMIEILERKPYGKCIGRCECGIIKEFYISNILSGKSKNCGCVRNKAHIPQDIKRTFSLMKYRCETETSPDFARWGGAGIKLLYKNVEEFYNDVGDKPSVNHSIDRINGKIGYMVGNCRWATHSEQQQNTKSNFNIEFNGETRCATEWSRICGIPVTTLKRRIIRGWSIIDSLMKPVDTSCYSKKLKEKYEIICTC